MTQFRQGGFQRLPMVVKNIIIINVIMVVLQYVLGRHGVDLSDYLGLHYWKSPRFRWWQIFTHLFMHGSPFDLGQTFMHIGLNMFALWMFGSILENLWGPQRFLIFYLVCGVGAALCHLGVLTYEFTSFERDLHQFVQTPGLDQYLLFYKHHHLEGVQAFDQIKAVWSNNTACADCSSVALSRLDEYYRVMLNEATVGASGAVFGVLFAFGYLFPNTQLMLLFPPVPIKAKWFVAIYAVIELYSGIQNSAGDNVAHFAHLGGMLFAFILLRIWGKNIRNNFY